MAAARSAGPRGRRRGRWCGGRDRGGTRCRAGPGAAARGDKQEHAADRGEPADSMPITGRSHGGSPLGRSRVTGTKPYVSRQATVSRRRRVSAAPACAIIPKPCQRAPSVGAWRSLVARIVRDDEVGGSNPLAPTKLTKSGLQDRSGAAARHSVATSPASRERGARRHPSVVAVWCSVVGAAIVLASSSRCRLPSPRS